MVYCHDFEYESFDSVKEKDDAKRILYTEDRKGAIEYDFEVLRV